MKSSYYVFLCVRDSESSIRQVMESLVGQTYPPEKIYVVNDGSTDRTGEIIEEFAEKYKGTIKVFKTGSVTTDYKRIPSLWNMCLDKQYDYHMISGGDTIFADDYAEIVLRELEKDPEIVVASGDNGKEQSHSPYGGGRFVKQDYFFKFYDKYPEIIGYESETIYKALVNGHKIRVFNDARFDHVDELGHKHNFNEDGPAMRAIGFHPAYVLWALFSRVKKGNIGRRKACKMLWQYLTFRPESDGYYRYFPEEDRKKIRDLHKREIRQKLGKIFP